MTNFYFVIPTINGLINGEPFIIESYSYLENIKEECTVYFVDLINYYIKEC